MISVFAGKILRGQLPTTYGDGFQSRDFAYIDNVMDATTHALQKAFHSRVFNIASGTETGILELAKMTQELAGRISEPKFRPPRLGDPYWGLADITRASRELGFDPETSLRDDLHATM